MVQQGIFYKLDWFTAVFENCSIFEVLDVLGIDLSYDVMEVYSNLYLSSKGYGTDVTFNFDGINIKTDLYSCFYRVFHTDDFDSINPEDFFSAPFSKIRMDLSGKALDQLRTSGFDVDSYFRVPFSLSDHQSYHVTRADFAFDLVDYAPDFLLKCCIACEKYCTDSGRLFTSTGGTGMKYSLRTGDQRTLYIGSPRSDKLLRIYDKKLQYEQAHRLQSDCPFNAGDDVPRSWIRIELQTRNAAAQSLLYDTEDSFQIFKFIYDNFAIRQGRGLEAPICEEWVNLFDWATIPRIIQNAKSVHYECIADRAGKYIRNIAFSNIVIHLADVGIDNFIVEISSELERLQKSSFPLDHRRWCSLLFKLNYMHADNRFPDHLSYDTSKGVYRLQ